MNTHLAVVKGAFHGYIVHISIGNGGHLCFLNGRNTAFWVEDEDGDIGFIPEAIDRSTTTAHHLNTTSSLAN